MNDANVRKLIKLDRLDERETPTFHGHRRWERGWRVQGGPGIRRIQAG